MNFSDALIELKKGNIIRLANHAAISVPTINEYNTSYLRLEMNQFILLTNCKGLMQIKEMAVEDLLSERWQVSYNNGKIWHDSRNDTYAMNKNKSIAQGE